MRSLVLPESQGTQQLQQVGEQPEQPHLEQALREGLPEGMEEGEAWADGAREQKLLRLGPDSFLLETLDHTGSKTTITIKSYYSGENKYLNPCRFRKFGHLQRNV